MRRTFFVAVLVFAFSAVTFTVMTPSSKADQPDCSTLTVITESLPTFFVGEPVNFQIEASGGIPPYQFKITTGALPPDLDMSMDGLITGVPTMATNTTIFVRVKTSGGCSTTRAYNVQVEEPVE